MKLVLDEPQSEALTAELAGRDERGLVSAWLLHTEMHCAAGRHPEDVDLEAVGMVLESVSLIDLTRGDLLAAGTHASLRSNSRRPRSSRFDVASSCRVFGRPAFLRLHLWRVEIPLVASGRRRVLDNGQGSWSKTPRRGMARGGLEPPTNKPICAGEPIAMLTARSILFPRSSGRVSTRRLESGSST
jgi:hypothetical protein